MENKKAIIINMEGIIMKKRILCLLVMCVTLFALTSCIFKKPDGGGGEKDPPSGDTGGTTDVEGVVFSPEVSASVIKARGDETLDLKPVTEKLFSLTGKLTLLNTDASSPEKHEIIFGNTSRELSSEALSLLDKRINAERREAEDANSEYTDIIGFGF